MLLSRISKLSGWLPPESRPAEKSVGSASTIFSKPSVAWKTAWKDLRAFYAFPQVDARKISFTNVRERLNQEIRHRTSAVGIFPSADACTRLVTAYLMEYAEDWSSPGEYLSKKSVQAMLWPAA